MAAKLARESSTMMTRESYAVLEAVAATMPADNNVNYYLVRRGEAVWENENRPGEASEQNQMISVQHKIKIEMIVNLRKEHQKYLPEMGHVNLVADLLDTCIDIAAAEMI